MLMNIARMIENNDAVRLQKALTLYRKMASRITIGTLGAFSADWNNRQAQAEQELENNKQEALINIPIIDAYLAKSGIKPLVTKPPHGDYTGDENVNDGNGHGE